MFIRIDGANRASFFFSAASFADWKKSLEFYQGVSALAKVKKILLLLGYPLAAHKAKMSAAEVAEALREVLPPGTEISFSDRDSAMISPARDKMIIHHHGRGYEKLAWGASYDGVKRELEFYRQLQASPPRHFVCSKLLNSSVDDRLVRFEMGYVPQRKNTVSELPLAALAEFFTLNQVRDVQWNTMWSQLRLPFDIPAADRDGMTPVGMVHRDFKPWNVKPGQPPQFFDFESIAEGLPLEDLFNYTADPALHFGSASECLREMRDRQVFDSAERLLALQGINSREIGRYWRWYLLERYDHFTKIGNTALADKFIELYRISGIHPVAADRARWSVACWMIAALILRLYYVWTHPIRSRDGITYIEIMQRYFEEGGRELLNSRPPLFCYLASCLMHCNLSAETAALTVNVAAGTLILIPLYLAGKTIWRKSSAGVAAAALGAVMTRLIKFSGSALRDGLYLHFAAWAIALWTMAIGGDGKSGRRGYMWSFLCGIAIAAGCMCRYEMAFFIPFTTVSMAVVALIKREWKQAIVKPLLLGLGVILGIAALSSLPGMPNVLGIYIDRLRVSFWQWKIWGMR